MSDYTSSHTGAAVDAAVVKAAKLATIGAGDAGKVVRVKSDESGYEAVTEYTNAQVDSGFVAVTGTQTVAGVKTFSSSPIVPTPTTDMQAGTKKYTDDLIALEAKAKLTAGGSIIYSSAANTLAELAKGTALQRLRMNAGETAPEWGNAGILQIVNSSTGAVATGTTEMPTLDDTIPQNTEGNQYMSLAITPKLATSILLIEARGHFGHSSTSATMSMALFQDSTADALAVSQGDYQVSANVIMPVHLQYYMVSGTTSEITFKIRAGGRAGTVTFNGVSGGRLQGGVFNSYIRIIEMGV